MDVPIALWPPLPDFCPPPEIVEVTRLLPADGVRGDCAAGRSQPVAINSVGFNGVSMGFNWIFMIYLGIFWEYKYPINGVYII